MSGGVHPPGDLFQVVHDSGKVRIIIAQFLIVHVIDIARLTACCGDHYYWVAAKTCVRRAISKEVLRREGLVSGLDYYNERHALKLC